MTFLGTYAIYLPMHYLGILGVPRRYFALGDTAFIPQSVHTINESITISALIVAAAQLVFLYNMITSLFRGEKAPPNPWGAASLEWQTPDTPPKHGNWGPHLPVVYRWATTSACRAPRVISFRKTSRSIRPWCKRTRRE
jgi:cytochrome c oxidase subunit 1